MTYECYKSKPVTCSNSPIPSHFNRTSAEFSLLLINLCIFEFLMPRFQKLQYSIQQSILSDQHKSNPTGILKLSFFNTWALLAFYHNISLANIMKCLFVMPIMMRLWQFGITNLHMILFFSYTLSDWFEYDTILLWTNQWVVLMGLSEYLLMVSQK